MIQPPSCWRYRGVEEDRSRSFVGLVLVLTGELETSHNIVFLMSHLLGILKIFSEVTPGDEATVTLKAASRYQPRGGALTLNPAQGLDWRWVEGWCAAIRSHLCLFNLQWWKTRFSSWSWTSKVSGSSFQKSVAIWRHADVDEQPCLETAVNG